MKRGILLILVALILSGCTKGYEFNKLIQQAEEHYYKDDIVSAIEVYQKALNLKEDVEARRRYQKLKQEIERIKEVLLIRKDLTQISLLLDTVTSDKILMEVAISLDEILINLQSIDTTDNSKISSYVKQLLQSASYFGLVTNIVKCRSYFLFQDFVFIEEKTKLKEAIDIFLNKPKFPTAYNKISI